jgi:sec-independent protein translocase protein TatA
MVEATYHQNLKRNGVTEMLGFDNPIHLLFLGVLLLLVFGAKRLPEMGRSLGAGMRGFKESISGEPAQHAELGPGSQSVTSAEERVHAASQTGKPQA